MDLVIGKLYRVRNGNPIEKIGNRPKRPDTPDIGILLSWEHYRGTLEPRPSYRLKFLAGTRVCTRFCPIERLSRWLEGPL